MTISPTTQSAVTTFGREVERAHRVQAVLATLPPDLSLAADVLQAACTAELGSDTTVMMRENPGWTVLAGPRTTGDGQAVEPALDSALSQVHPSLRAESRGRAAILAHASVDPSQWARLRPVLGQACIWLSLLGERAVPPGDAQNADADAEIAVFRQIVEQLLTVRDVDQVLLTIADRTSRLFDADICGVLLREGDEVRMRSCVGNRVVDTARTRMARGQGVAGLVFQTGEPALVDNYLDDHTISRDFVELVAKEQIQSALAVPLRLHGEFIGVLEVWRRRPSVFTDHDTARMIALANIATIAIDNARLYEEQVSALAQLQKAQRALQDQVGLLARSASLQQALLTTVLEGSGLPALARTVAAELGNQVAVYGPDGELVARHSGRTWSPSLPPLLRLESRGGRTVVELGDGSCVVVWMQPLLADGDKVGCVCLLPGQESAELMDIVSAQTAMACSLTLLRQREAVRARAESLDQVLWDLLHGSVEHRLTARARAHRLNVPLTGALRVVYGRLGNLDALASEHGWDTSRTDRARRDILRALHQPGACRGLVLAALRGDLISAIVSDLDAPAVKALVNDLTAAARARLTHVELTWGVSRLHDDPVALPRALDEAKTALAAAHRLGGQCVALYEDLGVVRLLLRSGNDPDLQTFIADITGPLVDYDSENDGALVRTLRAFFDADCSQRVAAERLFVHHKTLRYRLARIKQLTGLDLGRHEDRMRADFALRLLNVSSPIETADEGGDT